MKMSKIFFMLIKWPKQANIKQIGGISMSKNSVTITKQDVEASGRMRAEQGALHELKPIVSSMIDSVRGDQELVITVELKEGKNKDEKSSKKSSDGNDSKPKDGSNKGSNAKSKKKDDAGSTEDTAGSGDGQEQMTDPLADINP